METGFLLNTDNEIEKIIYFYEDSFLSTGANTIIHPHGLTFTPLPYVQWSLTPDFSIPQEVTQGFGDIYTSSFPYVTSAYTNGTNYIFEFANFGSNVTVYYRFYGLEPTNSGSPSVPFTSSISGLFDFSVNTDLLYLQTVAKDRIIVSGSQSVSHSLGARPTIMAWEEVVNFTHGLVTQPTENNFLYTGTTGAPLAAVSVGLNDITFTRSGTYHYRIYK